MCEELQIFKLTLKSLDDSKVRVAGSFTAQFNDFDRGKKEFHILGIQLIGNPLSS